MSSYLKRLSLIVLVLGAVIATVSLGARRIFLESFIELERQDMARNAERARDIIDEQLQQLDTINGDYSGWDEAYGFVQDENPAFVKSNLDAAIYPKLRLNLVAYFNDSGRPVYIKAYDYRHSREVPLPEQLQRFLTPGSMLLQHKDEKSALRGVLALPEGLMMISSRPVLTSVYRGPVKGTLVMGRYLDSAEVDRLALTTHLSLTVRPTAAEALPDDFRIAGKTLAGGGPPHVAADKTGQIFSYVMFRDIFGKEAFLVRVQAPRLIYQKGQETIGYFIRWCLAIGTGAAVFIHFLLGRLVLVRRQGAETEERYRTVVEQAGEGIVLLDPESNGIIDANAAFASFLGLPEDELNGRNFPELLEAGSVETCKELLRIEKGKRELLFCHRDGAILSADVSACRITFHDRASISLVINDVTERKSFEEQLMHQATHDPLTGLPNRNLFTDRLKKDLALARRRGHRVSLLLIDLDHFKVVNDTLGHPAGDELLVGVAGRMRKMVRASDTIARLGGDEFVVILAWIERPEELIVIAEKFLEVFQDAFHIRNREIFVTASMGIAHYPDDAESGDDLFRKADTALYHAKSQGRASFQFYAQEMNRLSMERVAIEAHLRHAISSNELSLHYQPMFDLASGRVTGVEALLRWTSADLGEVPPDSFIPVAEDTGLIVPIGEWVLRNACNQLKQWFDAGLPRLNMAVNISPRQFRQRQLVSTIREILQETGIEPQYLELELTENLMMSDAKESIDRMAQLKALGIRIAIDDFGTGFSSLNYLSQFPLDRLKIDKSFVTNLAGNKNNAAIISMILFMAHSLGFTVTAEGVETPEQLEFIRDQRCEEVQGMLISRPLPAGDVARFLDGTAPFPAATLFPAGLRINPEARDSGIADAE